MNRNSPTLSSILILLALFCAPAFANAGVPMLFVTLPQMVIALVPIIALEMWIYRKKMLLPPKQALKVSSIANVVSTVVGIPLTWGILVAIQMFTGGGRVYGLDTFFTKLLAVTWQSPWLIPYEGDLHWIVPTATLFLLIPFFFASWGIEYFVATRCLKEVETKSVKSGVFLANLTSYLVLFLLAFGWLVIAVMLHAYA